MDAPVSINASPARGTGIWTPPGSAVPVCWFIQKRLKIGTERVREKGDLLDWLYFDNVAD